MQRYIAARLIQAVVTLLLLSLAVFLSVRMTGNAADFLIGPEAEVSAEEYEQLKANLGLDKPLPVQYALFLTKIVRLDFGESIIMGRSAREVLLERFPATLELAGAALALTVCRGASSRHRVGCQTGYCLGPIRQVVCGTGHCHPELLDRYHVSLGVRGLFGVAPHIWQRRRSQPFRFACICLRMGRHGRYGAAGSL